MGFVDYLPLGFAALSAIFIGIGIIISVKQFIRLKNRPTLYMAATFFMIQVATILEAILYLNPSVLLARIVVYCYIIIFALNIWFVDSISRENIDPLKIGIFCFLSGIIIIMSTIPSNIVVLENDVIDFSTPMLVAFESMNVFNGLMTLFYIIKIHLRAPSNIKKFTLIASIGAFIFAVLSAIIVMLGLAISAMGIHLLTGGIGLALIMYAWIKEPKLAYILPFEASKLTVMDTKSGIPIFNFTWSESGHNVDDMLYSAMLQGIKHILNESVNKGNIRQLIMDNGLIILSHDEDFQITSIILTSRNSRYLNDSLQEFNKQFGLKFKDNLVNNLNVSLDDNSDAINLVERIFKFVPKYF